MRYPFNVRLVQEADDERCWVARSESLKGCIGTGGTPEEAIAELEENEAAWLEAAQEYGLEIPAVPYERTETYSGKFTVRVSPAVHQTAAEQARKLGISLNQYVNDAIVTMNTKEALSEGIKIGIESARLGLLKIATTQTRNSSFDNRLTLRTTVKPIYST